MSVCYLTMLLSFFLLFNGAVLSTLLELAFHQEFLELIIWTFIGGIILDISILLVKYTYTHPNILTKSCLALTILFIIQNFALAVMVDSFLLDSMPILSWIRIFITVVTAIHTYISGLLIMFLIILIFITDEHSSSKKNIMMLAYLISFAVASFFVSVMSNYNHQIESKPWLLSWLAISVLIPELFILTFITFARGIDHSIISFISAMGILLLICFAGFWCIEGAFLFDDFDYFTMPTRHYLMYSFFLLEWVASPLAFSVLRILFHRCLSDYASTFIEAQMNLFLYATQNNSVQIEPEVEGIQQSLLAFQVKESSNEECPICWGHFQMNQQALQVEGCGHYFHQECLSEWMRQDARCPLCRANLKVPEALIPSYY